MIQFQGFKPSGIEKIANAMGFQGEEKDFQKFLEENPDRQAEMMRYQDMARKMVSGGYIKKMADGGDTKKKSTITDITAKRVTDPKLPTGAVVNPYGVPTSPDQDIDPTKSKLGTTPTGTATTPTTASTATAFNPNRKFTYNPPVFFPMAETSQSPRADSFFFKINSAVA